jgi:hypothetical protein
MNWRKIYKGERLPHDEIIYTNGKTITVIGKDIYGRPKIMGDNIHISHATHYILLRELPKPWQKSIVT